jgi:hypothetical protein
MPRQGWVTAAKHREMRGSLAAPYPGPDPPPFLLAPPMNVRPARPPSNPIRLPSLAKTKQQAASWHRSLSFRRKNKPVIDPVDEVDIPVQNQGITSLLLLATRVRLEKPMPHPLKLPTLKIIMERLLNLHSRGTKNHFFPLYCRHQVSTHFLC